MFFAKTSRERGPWPVVGSRLWGGGLAEDFTNLHRTREVSLMAQWNSGAAWSSGQLWGPAAVPGVPFNENTKNQPTKMKRQPYYPRLIADQAEWHGNLATKLPGERNVQR